MKHIENEGTQIVILTKKEVDIIAAALTNRMVYLGKQKEGEYSQWAKVEWEKCLELQCEWFKIENINI